MCENRDKVLVGGWTEVMNLNCGSQGHLNCYFHVEAVEGLTQYLSGLYDEAAFPGGGTGAV